MEKYFKNGEKKTCSCSVLGRDRAEVWEAVADTACKGIAVRDEGGRAGRWGKLGSVTVARADTVVWGRGSSWLCAGITPVLRLLVTTVGTSTGAGPALEQDGLSVVPGLPRRQGFGTRHKGALVPGCVQRAVLAGQEGAAACQARQCREWATFPLGGKVAFPRKSSFSTWHSQVRGARRALVSQPWGIWQAQPRRVEASSGHEAGGWMCRQHQMWSRALAHRSRHTPSQRLLPRNAECQTSTVCGGVSQPADTQLLWKALGKGTPTRF